MKEIMIHKSPEKIEKSWHRKHTENAIAAAKEIVSYNVTINRGKI